MNRPQIKTSDQFKRYRDKERNRTAPIPAVLGDGHTHIEVGTEGVYVWARIRGDSRQIVRVRGVDDMIKLDDTPILVEKVPGDGKTVYRYLGRNDSREYSSDSQSAYVGPHAPQHQRGDWGSGGYDPLDVFNRGLIELRGQSQATPDMTVYVTPGEYVMNGVWHYWNGGSTGAFVAPTDNRMDLIYLGADLALHVLAGTDMPGPPTPPTVPTSNCFPIAWVLLTNATTSIDENAIANAKIIGTETGGYTSTHNFLSATHPDTLADSPVLGDIVAANGTPKWERIAGNVATVLKFLGQIGTGSVSALPAWQSLPLEGQTTYYLQDTASDIATYKAMVANSLTGSASVSTSGLGAGNTVLKNWATSAGLPGLSVIPAGIYDVHLHAAQTVVGGKTSLVYGEVWEVTAAGVDIAKIGTTGVSTPLTGSNAEYELAFALTSAYIMASTASRLVLRVYANVSGGGSAPTVIIYYGSSTNDSHLGIPSANAGGNSSFADTKANILAANKPIGTFALATDTNEIFVSIGSTSWVKVPFSMVADLALPDIGYTQSSSRIGINPPGGGIDGDITDYIFSNDAIGSNTNTANASATRIPVRAFNSTLQIYVSGAWQTIVSNFIFKEDSLWGYALEHMPVGFTMYLEVMTGSSLNNLGLNGLPLVNHYNLSMGAYPVPAISGGRTIG